MSKKQFSSLLVVTLVIAAMLVLIPDKTGNDDAFEVRPLVPGLEDWVNNVNRVSLVKGGSQTVATLVRNDKTWVMEEANSYPANWETLRGLLASLAQAQVIEPKTTNEAYYDRLGLVDVAQDSSEAILVELDSGDQQFRILVGNPAQGREGHYVRVDGDEQALLVDQVLTVKSETSDWLQRDIVDISESEVVEVRIIHDDGEEIVLEKKSADDQDFVLLNLPDEREIQSKWTINSIGGSLSMLQLEETDLADNIDWSGASKLQFLTADGLQLSLELTSIEEQSWIKLQASAHQSSNDSAASDSPEDNADSIELSAENDLSQRVEDINRRVDGWAYVIPQNKAQNMSKTMEEILKPLPDSE